MAINQCIKTAVLTAIIAAAGCATPQDYLAQARATCQQFGYQGEEFARCVEYNYYLIEARSVRNRQAAGAALSTMGQPL